MIPDFDMSDEKIIDNRKTIEEIKTCGLPIFIWGYVLTAKEVAQKLKDNGIAVEGWVTDKPGVKKEGVLSKDELIKNYPQYVLVRGFANAFKFTEDEVKAMWQGCQKSYIIADVYDGEHIEAISREYYLENKSLFDEVYDNMADDFSKNSLFAYIQAKVLKRHEPTLPYVEDTQYFFKSSLWKQSSSDVLLDCGAFDGDSIFTFVNLYGDNYKQIIACEPDPLSVEQLKKNMLARNIKNVVPLNVGVGGEKNILHFNSQDDMSSGFSNEGELTITVDTIDNIERLTGGGDYYN